MGNVTVIGAQWGDEGKGKIVDWLSNQADIVFRFQGGNNAGHTIVIKKKKIALSLIPSGVIRKETVSVIGNGVVVNPLALLDEIKSLRRHGVNINSKNLILSDCASIIFSFHKNIDKIREERKGVNKIGTTGRGIGPAYEDKIGRRAIRFGDLSDEDILNDKIRNILDYHNIILAGLNSKPLKFEIIKKEINSFRKLILKYVKRTAPILENARLKGKKNFI